MSFLIGLRASTSRSVLGYSSNTASVVCTGRRFASTVQEAEAELKRMKEQAADMERRNALIQQNHGGATAKIDIDRLDLPLMDPLTETPMKLNYIYGHWLSPHGGFSERWSYVKSALKRYMTTRQTVGKLARVGALDETTSEDRNAWGWGRSIASLFTISPRLEPTMRKALDMYVKYNEAMASGDVAGVKSVACSKMLRQGELVAKSRRKMCWELREEPRLPTLQWARESGLNQSTALGQVCLRFDTKQRLTTFGDGKKASIKDLDVTDYIVFRFLIPIESVEKSWRMMERVQPLAAGFTLTGAARREFEERNKKALELETGVSS